MDNTLVHPDVHSLLPFVVLLTAIAVGPLLVPNLWQNHSAKLCYLLGAIVVGYYLFDLKETASVWTAARNYTSFIVLVGSLYVVSGGIHIRVSGEATPEQDHGEPAAQHSKRRASKFPD